MDLKRRCDHISNGYYNRGLELAGERNLTQAAEQLKKALTFNKNNTNARNLLGLIYYQIGEISDALVQWVLSLNLQPYDNDADRYLSELQRQSGLMESYGQVIQKFNQSLALAQGGSDDLAALQLIKITEKHKNYLRAHLLLGLLYLANGDDRQAYKSFQQALHIDRGNPLAVRCVETIKSRKAPDSSRKSIREVFTGQDTKKKEDYIVPEPYKENTGLGTAASIGIGLLIGAAAILFIYVPGFRTRTAQEYNHQVINVSNSLNAANTEIKKLEDQLDELQAQYDQLNADKTTIDESYMAKLSDFQKIAGALRYKNLDDLKTAAQLFSLVDPENMIDVEDGTKASVKLYYDELKAFFDDDGYVRLTGLGDRSYEEGDYDTALEYYDLSIAVHPDNPAAIYKKGLCWVGKGEKNTANQFFSQVISSYPGTNIADMAKADRGY